MRKKNQKRNYNDMPSGKLTVVNMDIPPPEKLDFGEKAQKITIAVDPSTIDFFKVAAKKNGQKYQRIMREVLSCYVQKYRNKKAA